MGFLSDLKILYHLALRPVRGKDHAERMAALMARVLCALLIVAPALGGDVNVEDWCVSLRSAPRVRRMSARIPRWR